MGREDHARFLALLDASALMAEAKAGIRARLSAWVGQDAQA